MSSSAARIAEKYNMNYSPRRSNVATRTRSLAQAARGFAQSTSRMGQQSQNQNPRSRSPRRSRSRSRSPISRGWQTISHSQLLGRPRSPRGMFRSRSRSPFHNIQEFQQYQAKTHKPSIFQRVKRKIIGGASPQQLAKLKSVISNMQGVNRVQPKQQQYQQEFQIIKPRQALGSASQRFAARARRQPAASGLWNTVKGATGAVARFMGKRGGAKRRSPKRKTTKRVSSKSPKRRSPKSPKRRSVARK